jgi:hypothetical protein
VTQGLTPESIVDRYCAATRNQGQSMYGSTMNVEISATLPNLKKQGKLHAVRRISTAGQVSYDILGFEGDGTVKSQVINRYLSAEAEAQQQPSHSLDVTPENYKFKFRTIVELDGRNTYLFDISPRHKRQGLFKGQLWIDVKTSLRVQESGQLVKSPSFLLKKITFLRKYQIRDGISLPRQETSRVDTRIVGVGHADMTIDFSNFAIDRAVGVAAGIE